MFSFYSLDLDKASVYLPSSQSSGPEFQIYSFTEGYLEPADPWGMDHFIALERFILLPHTSSNFLTAKNLTKNSKMLGKYQIYKRKYD